MCWQRQVLRHIRVIAAEAKQELMNAFRREMTLQLVAISLHKSAGDVKRLLHRKKSSQSESWARQIVGVAVTDKLQSMLAS